MRYDLSFRFPSPLARCQACEQVALAFGVPRVRLHGSVIPGYLQVYEILAEGREERIGHAGIDEAGRFTGSVVRPLARPVPDPRDARDGLVARWVPIPSALR